MQEFSAYIDFCVHQFQGIQKCQNCPYGKCINDNDNMPGHDCYSCLNKIHRYTNNVLSYRCDRIIYNYVLKHGHRYASEIDKELALLRPHVNIPAEMNVYSVGCGPCTELFGVIRRLGSSTMHFKGFDTNPVWKPINDFQRGLFPNTDIQFLTTDFFDYLTVNDDHVDVLVLNYMLSDLARYETQDTCSSFVDKIVGLCEQKRVSCMVINDVYLCYASRTGYALMEELARKLLFNKNINERIGRGRFATPNAFQVAYGKHQYNNELSFPIVEQSVKPFAPFATCNSLFMFVLIQ